MDGNKIFLFSLIISYWLFGSTGCDTSTKPGQVLNANAIHSSLQMVPEYVKGELIESEDFSEGLKNWLLEGKVLARIDNGKLLFESFDDVTDNPKGNIWWKVDIYDPFVLEFDYRSLSENGLSMIFWNATDLDGGEVLSVKRTGRYEEYINGMHAYHVSFHRFGSGKSNIRKAPGFHLVSSVPDPIALNDSTWHRITIASKGNQQRVFVDGSLIHDFADESLPCLSKESWQHSLPCKGTGSVPFHGAIGIRHTQKQKALYDNFKVFKLIKE